MATSESLKRTPLYECHVEAGARLVDFAGWEMPVQYQGVIEEHRAVRTAAGIFDVSHMGEVRVQGPGAEAFLQRLTPNDVSKLAPGRAHYSGLLTDAGTYVDDLLVYRIGAEEFLVVVNASNADRDFEWIASRAGSDARVTNESDRWALVALQGPKAVEMLRPLAPPAAMDLKYYGFLQGDVAGRPALISRTGYTGEDGFELYVAPEDAPAIWRRLLEAGALPAGLGARDTLRLEASMALYGHEIDESTTPFEAGLAWVVKMNKGDFQGRAALAAQQAEGPRRKLIGFEVQGRGIARQGHAVKSDGRAVGAVTSGTWSPSFEKAIGMAYVPVELAAPGTPLEIDVRGKGLSAAVVEVPFYRRPK
ncbi:MAG: glycine cleavage system aminomethyltransferase GcvT [Thermoanaerobaculia bacterium]